VTCDVALDPRKATWTVQEDRLVTECQEKWGNKWSRIAALLPGRTDNAVKNRWNSALKRRFDGAVAIGDVVSHRLKLPATREPIPAAAPAAEPPAPPASALRHSPAPIEEAKPRPGLFDDCSPFAMGVGAPGAAGFDDGTPFEVAFGYFDF
jgi:hypothetical protein